MNKKNYDLLLKRGNRAQMEKLLLPRCIAKKHWNTLSLNDLHILKQKEDIELQEEFHNYYNVDVDDKEAVMECFKNIRNEAADIANFAHMLIEQCDIHLGND